MLTMLFNKYILFVLGGVNILTTQLSAYYITGICINVKMDNWITNINSGNGSGHIIVN